MDADHDGWITRAEAAKWPEFSWNYSDGQDRVSVADLRAYLDGAAAPLLDKVSKLPLYSDGVFDRGPIYKKAAALGLPLQLFTGEVDLQTPLRESQALIRACADVGKKDCALTVVPGVGHGFSPPKGPRHHPFLDMTVGPVEESFAATLKTYAESLKR